MSRFLIYRPTPEDVAEAFRRSEKLGVPPNSLTRGKGRMVGFLGEIAFEKAFPEAIYVGDRSFTHDYEIGKLLVDIKSKACNSRPMNHYIGSVPANDPTKPLKTQVYFFNRVLTDLSKVWLCGWVTKTTLQKPNYFKQKGETDKSGFTFLNSGYHIPFRLTRRPDSFPCQCRIGEKE